MVHTSANWILPVSTRSLASEHMGTECFTTGWRFKISEVWKGSAESRLYLRAATVMPNYKGKNIDIQSRCRPFRSPTLVIKILEKYT